MRARVIIGEDSPWTTPIRSQRHGVGFCVEAGVRAPCLLQNGKRKSPVEDQRKACAMTLNIHHDGGGKKSAKKKAPAKKRK